MIGRQEILDFAADLGLDPQVVEKDYMLGWVLAGVGQHAEIGSEWLFKGGTCLKKCYFETYRFSEDLDFTILNPAHLSGEFLTRVFNEIAAWIYMESGIEIPVDTHRFEVYGNPRGKDSVQGRVGYRGPLGRQGSIPRIKLDLSNDERVVLEADRREVHHPYSDRPGDGIQVLTYCFEEVFSEKTRALAERLRPRDLYDVVHLYRRSDLEPDLGLVVDTLRQKCEFKGIPVPTIATLNAHPELPALRNDWETMLAHQLPALPSFDEFWNELPQVFEWLFEQTEKVAAPAIGASIRAAEELDETWHAPVMASSWRRDGITAPLELIRFAAANHLCVDLRYRDKQGRVGSRLIEPYSLRRTKAGDLLLHAVRHEDGKSRSYLVNRILGAAATKTSFVPGYAIELTASGPINAPMSARSVSPTKRSRPFRISTPTRQRAGFGPSYVYRCGYCGKTFTRKNMNSTLNPHKTKDGWPCPGRTGIYVETKY
ncbi:MAG: nucleotidyl transferase AbiEii/AbiGii toxin family protein [Gammaproteobacteria bacterium]